MEGTLIHLEQLPVDAPWGPGRGEPKLPAVLRLFDSDLLSEEFVDMLDGMGIYNFKGIVVGLSQQFQFIEGLPQPCAIVEDCLPLRQWLMCYPGESDPEKATPDNVTIFSVLLGEVN